MVLNLANINVRIDSKIELALKKEANTLGVSLSDLVRERLTGERADINEITLENRIEQLEKEQLKLANILHFQTRFLYHFAVSAANNEIAKDIWNKALEETKGR